MPLTMGTRLAYYDVTALIGEGADDSMLICVSAET